MLATSEHEMGGLGRSATMNAIDLQTVLSESLQAGTLISVVLSKPTGDDAIKKVTGRPIQIRDESMFQLALRSGNQETHENISIDELTNRLAGWFPDRFANCHLFTNSADYQFELRRGGEIKSLRSRPTKKLKSAEHNRSKNYLIPEGTPCAFLEAIDVMTRSGKVRKARYSKFRQINRFLEFIDDVLEELPLDEIRVVDFGCGKSYLTLAMHHFFRNIRGVDCHILGLDLKKSVIEDCQRIAERLNLEGLEFRVGDIASHQQDERVDLVVALHACDTATDATLAQSIRWNARVILSVPCCQHELNAQMTAATVPGITEHGILRDRLAAITTDALRAKLLEIHGYQTQVMEFIDMEHTAKNLLIRAIRSNSNNQLARQQDEYAKLKQLLGIDTFALEKLLAELSEEKPSA
ncbi:MAG: SAM-dependent methyltransferase [Planctomycetaceae bacterium]|nr:SAM-dependent methyltransferase [Planctomycetaceae bacterium]